MASFDKQPKRAQRAKAKVHVVQPLLANPLINEPFNDVAIDLSTFDFQDIEEHGFVPAHFDDLFQAIKGGEGISLLAMCLVFRNTRCWSWWSRRKRRTRPLTL